MDKRTQILIIDAQGGGIGKALTAQIKKDFGARAEITAVGANSRATLAMMKAGADHAATGENAAVVGARRADIIIGPIGIVIADALYGEITPKMARAVGQSPARRILIPVNHCDNTIVGVGSLNLAAQIQEVSALLENTLTH